MRTIFLLLGVLCVVPAAFTQTVTFSGFIRDTTTLASLDSCRIEIVNSVNSTERYTVFTNAVGAWSFTFASNSVGEDEGKPIAFSLGQNYPNPFNPSTVIHFSVCGAGVVTLKVHTILGQQVDEKSFPLTPGEYSVP
ncbi:MAG: hypothetical protein ABI623_09235, partial [bacterium]